MQPLLVRLMLLTVVFITIPLIKGQQVSVAPNEKTVSIPISVWTRDKGFLKSLKANDFEIYEEKKRLDILSFTQNDEPQSVGILLDLSGSVSHSVNRIPFAVSGLLTFLNSSHPHNEYFLIGFAEDQKLLVNTTQNRSLIVDSLNDLATVKGRGNTRLYDALVVGLEKVSALNHAKKVLIIVSDGQDTVSKKADFGDVKKLTKHEDILLYLVNIRSRKDPETLLRLQADQFFQVLTADSGGRGFYPTTPHETIQAFEMLADELRSQYIVEIRLPNRASHKPKWHELKLKLSRQTEEKLGKVFVRIRKGFYF